MTKGEKAAELFSSGLNCSQAVFCSFADDMGIPYETALKLAAGFGGGMGRMREVCGAVSGMIMACSYMYASTDPTDHEKKKELYERIRTLADSFREQNGSIICRELLGLTKEEAKPGEPEKRSEEYYHKRPCGEICRVAADILGKYMEEN